MVGIAYLELNFKSQWRVEINAPSAHVVKLRKFNFLNSDSSTNNPIIRNRFRENSNSDYPCFLLI